MGSTVCNVLQQAIVSSEIAQVVADAELRALRGGNLTRVCSEGPTIRSLVAVADAQKKRVHHHIQEAIVASCNKKVFFWTRVI